jgi:hypothetical protein
VIYELSGRCGEQREIGRGRVFSTEAQAGDDAEAIPRKRLCRASDAPDRQAVAQHGHDASRKPLVIVAESPGIAADLAEIGLGLDLHAANSALRIGRVIEAGSSEASSLQRVACLLSAP